jgi:hypothetical protein
MRFQQSHHDDLVSLIEPDLRAINDIRLFQHGVL